MKNPLKQMKQVQAGMAMMMHAVYLAGLEDGQNNKPLLSLKEFAKVAKNIHTQGKAIQKKVMLHGTGNNTSNDEEKSH